jgi:hypothetical protein
MPRHFRREIAARKAAFLGVAAAFVTCAKNDVGDTAKLYFRRAGQCFESAEEFVQAIAAYRSASYFNRIAELYLKLAKYDEAVATVQNHDINPDIVERVKSVARLFYFRKGQLE